MVPRRAVVIGIVIVVVALLGFYSTQYVKGRLSWYYLNGEIDGYALLKTCEAGTPVFSSVAFYYRGLSQFFYFPSLEVSIVCWARDEYADEIVSLTTSYDSTNEALRKLVDHHLSCTSSNFSPDIQEICKKAHFSSIDWLLVHGVDINAGKHGGVIQQTVHSVNESMFEFLISRGADPTIEPLGYKGNSSSSDPYGPKTTIELIEMYIFNSEYEFPKEVAAWKRMLELANESIGQT